MHLSCFRVPRLRHPRENNFIYLVTIVQSASRHLNLREANWSAFILFARGRNTRNTYLLIDFLERRSVPKQRATKRARIIPRGNRLWEADGRRGSRLTPGTTCTHPYGYCWLRLLTRAGWSVVTLARGSIYIIRRSKIRPTVFVDAIFSLMSSLVLSVILEQARRYWLFGSAITSSEDALDNSEFNS